MTNDQQRGLYAKYRVERLDDPDGKHADCRYFVLDPHHDRHARIALQMYADSCRDEFPKLADDLQAWLDVELTQLGILFNRHVARLMVSEDEQADIDAILEASDEQILAWCAETLGDPEQVAARSRRMFEQVVARLDQAKRACRRT